MALTLSTDSCVSVDSVPQLDVDVDIELSSAFVKNAFVNAAAASSLYQFVAQSYAGHRMTNDP
ncbi:GH17855 [Drosophila grimshawi]|uniref:GH17855 n=1 Tax=Drosophila grimshawi TaxID=7222 RepID=B4JX01_DROGR|nr:GH17855 [Drosophila grimshawi]